MKNLNYVGAIVFWVVLLGSLIFGDDYSSWQSERKNKKISEEGLQRLVDNYGLESRYTTEDFNQCNYQYAFYKAGIDLGQSDKELIDKDIFMVNCIPVIKYVMDQCDFKEEDMEFEISDLSFRFGCEEQVLDQIIYK